MTYDAKTIARFWAKVNRRGPDECWEWTAYTNKGYGRISVSGSPRDAHRVAWEIVNGNTNNLCVLHRCDNPPCVNPSHLFLGTQLENIADMLYKGRGALPPRGCNLGKTFKVPHRKPNKLTGHEVSEILVRIGNGEYGIDLSKEFGVSEATISRLRNDWGCYGRMKMLALS